MPRYYFDLTTNGQKVVDVDGDELSGGDEEALAYVRRLLIEQLPSLLRDGFDGEMKVEARDGQGPRFRIRLSVAVE